MSDDARPDGPPPTDDPDRRGFLKNASRVAMTAGVVGGYGGFALVAGRFLYPSRTGEVMWQFVSEVDAIDVGGSIRYRGPSGETINIARMSREGGAEGGAQRRRRRVGCGRRRGSSMAGGRAPRTAPGAPPPGTPR